MMLAMVGSGEYLPDMEPVDRALIERLGGNPRVVCLPTAAGTEGPQRIRYWMDLGVSHFTRLGASVESLPVLDRKSADDPQLAAKARAARFVYLSGGKPDYLYQALKGSRVWDAIQAVLTEGGLLAGCSAGAMVQGERIPGFTRWGDGFGLLPGIGVIPHFDEFPAAMSRAAMLLAPKGITILGVEGYTALVHSPAGNEVLGRGGVTVLTGKGRPRYTAGQAITW
jgi:cyanophycinase